MSLENSHRLFLIISLYESQDRHDGFRSLFDCYLQTLLCDFIMYPVQFFAGNTINRVYSRDMVKERQFMMVDGRIFADDPLEI